MSQEPNPPVNPDPENPDPRPQPPPIEPCAEAPVSASMVTVNALHLATMIVDDLAQQIAEKYAYQVSDVKHAAKVAAWAKLSEDERAGLTPPGGKVIKE